MKLTYIIKPFESAEYLIRCVNSLYRQTSAEFDVILAENKLGETAAMIESCLAGRTALKRISAGAKTPSEKLDEAIEIFLQSGGEYAVFLNVDSVVLPKAASAITAAAANGAQIVCMDTAVIKGEGAVSYIFSGDNDYKDNDRLRPENVCLGRALIEKKRKSLVFAENRLEFILEIADLMVGGAGTAFARELCVYEAAVHESSFIKELPDRTDRIAGLLETAKGKLGRNDMIYLTDCFARGFKEILESDRGYDSGTKARAFECLKRIGNTVCTDNVMKMFFSLYFNANFDNIKDMDYSLYSIYLSMQPLKRQGKTSPENAGISDITGEEDIESIKNEIEALKKTVNLMSKGISAGNQTVKFADPITDIPQMYAEGRLGFKVILRSIKGWFRYKFSRRK